jgi:hypothetical protein
MFGYCFVAILRHLGADRFVVQIACDTNRRVFHASNRSNIRNFAPLLPMLPIECAEHAMQVCCSCDLHFKRGTQRTIGWQTSMQCSAQGDYLGDRTERYDDSGPSCSYHLRDWQLCMQQ